MAEITAALVPPSVFEQALLADGDRRCDNILRWATVDCVKAGWLVKSHGRWSLTDEGRTAHAQITDPTAFYKRANQLYTAWRKNNPKGASSVPPADTPADDGGGKSAATTFEHASRSKSSASSTKWT